MNEALKEKIKQLRKEKLTFREIGERLGISRQRASVLFQAGGGKQDWGKWAEFADAWKKELDLGETYTDISKKYQVPTSTIFYHVKKEVFQFDALKEKIKQLRKEKLTFREIGERLGISKQRASQLFQSSGGKQTWGKWEKFAKDWKQEIEAGATYEEVAKKYKTSTRTIFYHVKKEVFQFDFTCEKCGKVTFGLANVKGQSVSWNCPECDYYFRENKEKFFQNFKQT